jgi:hypothetical protein
VPIKQKNRSIGINRGWTDNFTEEKALYTFVYRVGRTSGESDSLVGKGGGVFREWLLDNASGSFWSILRISYFDNRLKIKATLNTVRLMMKRPIAKNSTGCMLRSPS